MSFAGVVGRRPGEGTANLSGARGTRWVRKLRHAGNFWVRLDVYLFAFNIYYNYYKQKGKHLTNACEAHAPFDQTKMSAHVTQAA